jgi:hypothetical protein
MAYKQNNLQPIGGSSKAGNAPQMWSYQTEDAKTVVDTEGYFNDASSLLKKGDLIYVYASTGGTATYSLHPVLESASGVVDVSDGTALSTTDTD